MNSLRVEAYTLATRASTHPETFAGVRTCSDALRTVLGDQWAARHETQVLPDGSRIPTPGVDTVTLVVLTDGDAWACSRVWHPFAGSRRVPAAEDWAVAASSALCNGTVFGESRSDLVARLLVAINDLTFGPYVGPWVAGVRYLLTTCPAAEQEAVDAVMFLAMLSPYGAALQPHFSTA